jgi:hypothetical protein
MKLLSEIKYRLRECSLEFEAFFEQMLNKAQNKVLNSEK